MTNSKKGIPRGIIGLPLDLNISHVWWKNVMSKLMTIPDILDMTPEEKLEKCKDSIIQEFDNYIYDEAMIFVETFLLYDPEDTSIGAVLSSFRKEMERRLDGPHSYDQLKYLVEAKNRIVRRQVILSIRNNNGFFNPEIIINFVDRCETCKGTGELYRFSKVAKKTSCNACKDIETGKSLGYIFETCPKCHGKKKIYEDPELQEELIDCPRCFDDNKGESTGTIKVKCKSCLGTKVYSKYYLDNMESTTGCTKCRGNGWKISKKKLRPAEDPFNAVLSSDDLKKINTPPPERAKHLGDEIKSAEVTEQ